MRFTGIPANLLSLGAIDFGIIVDGAVIMAEHLIRKYRTASSEERKNGIVSLTLSSAQDVGREILFYVTIIVLDYLQILLMTRDDWYLFELFVFSLVISVIGSLQVSLSFHMILRF